MADALLFDPWCRECPRITAHLAQIRLAFPSYHARSVAPFGPLTARLLIVGLAPGLHGAKAAGRLFTGDLSEPMVRAVLSSARALLGG